ncbi:hypothetical protein Poly51_04540 [Rubripirellula tenax]|uniref:O-Antigen ligase n=1 Tax=Rubripirellula tenax TaxID=2528015 RepID=A0A5C6FJF0_9BACT|nr:hypothetical protein [Rubripirellula tenax]TWU60179.1 hypothetical protein Poly51_04540 [Rubripirellula tenax]
MNYQTVVIAFTLLAIFVPQFVIAVPEFGDQIKTTDLFAVLSVPVAFFAFMNRRSMQLVQIVAIAVICFSATVVITNIFQSSDRRLYQENLPHLARLFSIHSLLFLVVAMPTDRQFLSRSLIAFGCLATFASVCIAVLYHFGSGAFDAHQTFERDGGASVHRLGGLVGESGAYAFNATMGFQLLLAGLAMVNKRRLYFIALWIVFPVLVALIYHESLVRISLLMSILFFLICVTVVNHSATALRGLLAVSILSVVTVVILMSAAGHPIGDIQIDRLEFDGDANRLSSGRVANWVEAADVWTSEPMWILFGMGHRASDFVLMHPIENMAVFHLVNYGLIGSALFLMLYGYIFAPIFKQALRGDFAGGVFSALILSVLVQWQVNDINLYFQTFPIVLFFSAWYSSNLRSGVDSYEQPESEPSLDSRHGEVYELRNAL